MGKRKPKPKVPKATIYQALAKVINKTSKHDVDFDSQFYVTEQVDGVFKVLKVLNQEDKDIVKFVPNSAVSAELAKYCATHLVANQDFHLTAKEIDAAVDNWIYTTTPVQPPRAFCVAR